MTFPTASKGCTRHRARGYRDANGREIGALCLSCGTIIARAKVDDETLRLAALTFLIREEAGEVELETPARRRLQAIRRRAAREQARRNRQEADDA